MTKVFLLLNLEDNQNKEIVNLLEQNQFELAFAQGNIEENILQINNFLPDLILIDNKIEHCEFTLRQIKTSLKHLNIHQISLYGIKQNRCIFFSFHPNIRYEDYLYIYKTRFQKPFLLRRLFLHLPKPEKAFSLQKGK